MKIKHFLYFLFVAFCNIFLHSNVIFWTQSRAIDDALDVANQGEIVQNIIIVILLH